MPSIDVNGTTLHYIETGSGPETVVFSHGFLMDHRMFDHQIAELATCYRVIAFDHRGHGQSAQCRTPFGMYDLVDDAAALIRQLCDGPVHFAGMSTGGFVGVRLALRAPELIRSLTLIDTAAGAEDQSAMKQYNQLLFAVRLIGTRPLLGKVMPILMAQPFLTDPARTGEVATWRKRIVNLDKGSIYRFGKAIFNRDSVLDALEALTTQPPTLIIVGEDDIATPVAQSRKMQAAIAGSSLVTIPRAGHSAPVETPAAVTDAMTGFLAGVSTSAG
ncbi:alpha/beta fold hydrolase [uncultured Tateyamaria sp.]|uniref:alpha/beta fold hydrolase n=1 Tax=uncultured Tateyamaria sp. TaxID=455651 RepID=UPI0026277417|nr:alpha/beta fold hydrolase [uncultured Tateyamaria sp.]